MQTSGIRSKVFTIKIILLDVFQCLVDEVHAPQSLWRETHKEHKCNEVCMKCKMVLG